MYESLVNMFKNENLSPALLAIKRVGQFGFALFPISIGIFQMNGGQVEGNSYVDIAAWLLRIGLVIGIICFSTIVLDSLRNPKGGNDARRSFLTGFKKIVLFMYLPAIVLATILVILFVLPRYN